MGCEKCNESDNGYFKSVIHRKNVELLLIFILCVLQSVGLIAYAIYNKWVDSQYETVDEDIRVISDDNGDANYIGHDGDITYHGSDTD